MHRTAAFLALALGFALGCSGSARAQVADPVPGQGSVTCDVPPCNVTGKDLAKTGCDKKPKKEKQKCVVDYCKNHPDESFCRKGARSSQSDDRNPNLRGTAPGLDDRATAGVKGSHMGASEETTEILPPVGKTSPIGEAPIPDGPTNIDGTNAISGTTLVPKVNEVRDPKHDAPRPPSPAERAAGSSAEGYYPTY